MAVEKSKDKAEVQNGGTHTQGDTKAIQDTSNNSNYRLWEEKKNEDKQFYEDPEVSFFWRAHTITCLVLFTVTLLYVTVYEQPSASTEFNTKRGLLAVALVFLLYGVIYTPDGPFVRPHPAVWRFVLCLSILYELCLIFLLFQNAHDARQLLRYIDPELGKPLPEKDYGGSCLIYDANNTADPFHNVWDKMDGFVTTHFIGWWLKAVIIRDYWLCNIISFMFEVMEYTFEHQLPNFSECWWDHWIMDFLVCNGLGIILGMMTCHYLSLKRYSWTALWKIPSYSGKLKRIALQFTPLRWTDFNWKPTKSFNRWMMMLLVISMFLLAELNTFYLKFTLWVPPPHKICLGRLIFFLLMGATALREIFQFLDEPNCKFGRQSWIISAIIVTEALISIKFEWKTVTKPLPTHVIALWAVGLTCLTVWTVWNFFISRLFHAVDQRNQGSSSRSSSSGGSSSNFKLKKVK